MGKCCHVWRALGLTGLPLEGKVYTDFPRPPDQPATPRLPPTLPSSCPPSTCHAIHTFFLTSKSLPLVAPQILRPKTRRSPKSRWLSSQMLSSHLEKPVALRSTRRTRPLATRASAWAPPLFRKDFTIYIVQVSFVRFSISFCLGSSALHFILPYIFAIVHRRTFPPRGTCTRCRAHRNDSVKFLRLRGPLCLFSPFPPLLDRRIAYLSI